MRELSPSMDSLRTWYSNLDNKAEQSFLEEYFQLHLSFPTLSNGGYDATVLDFEIQKFTNVAINIISNAQELVRGYNVPRVFMSIRNLIRCTQLFSWLMNFSVPVERGDDGVSYNLQNIFLPSLPFIPSDIEIIKSKMRNALIMAVTVTYMFQLPSSGHVSAGKATEDLRLRFVKEIIRTASWESSEARTQFEIYEQGEDKEDKEVEWVSVVDASLKRLFSFAKIPSGVAETNAIRENYYCVVLAAMLNMPVLIRCLL